MAAQAGIVTGPGGINLTNTGTIAGATYGLTLGGSGIGSVSSIIGTASGTLTKNGAGSWTLSGAGPNTYTGLTTVNSGTLIAAKDGALGGTGSGTTVANGAVLHVRTTLR